MEHYQYIFDNVDEEQNDILIAMLSDIGFDGFEETEHQLKAFTKKDIDREALQNVVDLAGTSYALSVIPEVNWNEIWEAGFEPVTVLYPGSEKIFASVRAGFHLQVSGADHDIVVTPKMSFGTGHHPTTYGMIETMSALDFKEKVVIDFGTGTGVLAILAEKLGASRIVAIDNDDWSISNAAENVSMNGCSRIELVKAEGMSGTIKADIILANINLNVILTNLELLINALGKDTVLILSGMLSGDKSIITEALKKYPVKVIRIYERNNWIVLLSTVVY